MTHRVRCWFAAIACEVKIKTFLREHSNAEQAALVELLLENPRDWSLAAAALFDKPLKIVGGRSLKDEDDKSLWKGVIDLFERRNALAHRGKIPTQAQALACLSTSRKVFGWLALGSKDGSEPAGASQFKTASTESPPRKRSTATSASPGATGSAGAPNPAPAKPQRRSPSPDPPASRSRTADAIKSGVLAALAAGHAMTAGEVAKATGLSRSTVTTTLSRLAKSGEVAKSERAYEAVSPSKPAA